MSHSLDGIELVPENACPECGVDVNELTAEIERLKQELLELKGELAHRAPPGPPGSMLPNIARYRICVSGVEYDVPWQVSQEIDRLREHLLSVVGDRNILREALIERLERDRRSGRSYE